MIVSVLRIRRPLSSCFFASNGFNKNKQNNCFEKNFHSLLSKHQLTQK